MEFYYTFKFIKIEYEEKGWGIYTLRHTISRAQNGKQKGK